MRNVNVCDVYIGSRNVRSCEAGSLSSAHFYQGADCSVLRPTVRGRESACRLSRLGHYGISRLAQYRIPYALQ